jgi:hypothetical protein
MKKIKIESEKTQGKNGKNKSCKILNMLNTF